MLQLEGYVEIQVFKRKGKSIRAISAGLGVARNTVRKYLRAERTPRSRPRPSRASKLDPFPPVSAGAGTPSTPVVDSGIGAAVRDFRARLHR
jgi:transposase